MLDLWSKLSLTSIASSQDGPNGGLLNWAGIDRRVSQTWSDGPEFARADESASSASAPDNMNGSASSLFWGDYAVVARRDATSPAEVTVFTKVGNDTLLGGGSSETLAGGAGDDAIDGGFGGSDWLLGGQGRDVITSHGGDAILNGNMDADTLVGGTGHETIRGGQGDDSIAAGEGNDWISGDRGEDVISGGSGADSFYTFTGASLDRVVDFSVSEGDRVLVAAGSHYTVDQVGADTIIDLGGGDRLVLLGVTKASLAGSWIVEL